VPEITAPSGDVNLWPLLGNEEASKSPFGHFLPIPLMENDVDAGGRAHA
jgi:hypothetical protein